MTNLFKFATMSIGLEIKKMCGGGGGMLLLAQYFGYKYENILENFTSESQIIN